MSTYLLWNEFGNMYSKMGNLDSAVDAYQKAIEMAPDVGLPYSNLGMCYFHQGENVKALSLCQRSIELSGNHKEKTLFWNRLGEIHARLGEYEESVAAYQKAKELVDGEETETKVGFVQEVEEFTQEDCTTTPQQEGNVIATDESEDGSDPVTDDEIEFENWLKELEKDTSVENESIYDDSEVVVPGVENTDTLKSALDEADFVGVESESHLPADDNAEVGNQFNRVDLDLLSADELDSEENLDLNRLEFAEIEPPDGFQSNAWHVLSESAEDETLANIEETPDNQISEEEQDQRFAIKVTRQLREIAWLSPLLGSVDIEENPEEGSISLEDSDPEQIEDREGFNGLQTLEDENDLISPVDDEMLTMEESDSLQNGGNDCLANDEERAVTDEVVLPRAHGEFTGQTSMSEGQDEGKDESKSELYDAIAIYERITHLAPTNDKAWDKLGNLYKDIGSFDQAKYAYEKAISVSPAQALYHYHLGLVNTAQKNYDDAIVTFKKIIEMNPDYVLAHCALAGCYRRLGKDAEADEHVEIARPHMQSESEYNQACFEAICGNTEEAIQLLAVAIENEQTTVDWISVDPDLDFIRDEPRFQSLINQEYEDSEVEVRFL